MIAKFIAAAAIAGAAVAGIASPAAASTKPHHLGYYRSIDDLTYGIKLVGWAPSTEVTLFKAVDGGAFQQVPGICVFSGSTVFHVGIRPETSLEIDIWNGHQHTYRINLTAAFITDGYVPAFVNPH